MTINIGLDTEGIREAINCYLSTRLINAHTYDVKVRIIAGRSGDSRPTDRAELELTRKTEYGYLDCSLSDDDEVEEVSVAPARLNAPTEAAPEETEDVPFETQEPVEVADKPKLPTATMGSSSLFKR